MEDHLAATQVPFVPTVHQLADLIMAGRSRRSERGHWYAVSKLYNISNSVDEQYSIFELPKPDGGIRIVYMPSPFLKLLQEQIYKKLLYAIPVSKYAVAYVPGMNLRDGAARHVGHPVLLKLDIHHFFDSITYSMVLSYVFNSKRFPKEVGVLLTSLCCYKGCLPQGAPTSPAISNIVMYTFDEMIGQYCEKMGIVYSRYSDDMRFSGDFSPGRVIRKVDGLLSSMGFSLNTRKTHIAWQGQQQLITGVIVNSKEQAPAAYRRVIRQEMYYCRKYGVRSHILHADLQAFIAEDSKSHDGKRVYQKKYLQHLLGKINYCLCIDPENKELLDYFSSVLALLKE